MNLDQIQIARDQWGIPHIFGKTDQDVAYGLAIASCEDGFQTIQETLSLGNQCFGEIKGIKGLEYDYVTQLVELDKTVNKNYDKISKEFKEYLEAYCLGLNRYAHKHSKKVIAPSLFPVTPKKILKAAQVATMGFARVGDALSSMIHGGQKNHKRDLGGSNAFAFSKKIVEENETVLVINPHQPIKGFMRYYEFHLCSEEGLDVIGASLMGLPIVILGSNKNLAWALTRNYTDLYDTYKLKMHPSKKLYYDLDGEWRKLKKKKAPLSFKLFGFLPIKVSKAIYKSAHGPVAKGKDGFYALRMPAADEIRAPEQWFRMNKAQNYRDFKEALNMQAFASGNLIYADKDDNIYYLYNGLFAEKNEKYNWKDHLPGDVSEVIWPKEYLSLDKLPQVLNPPSGYVYSHQF
ncbi:MAG: penicillin acylase family protein, partial [Flavobacteriales bacterium]|nr:penicillin acylase family protein [Flavobacteriales bacterium]